MTVTLTWTAVPTATSYNVWRGTVSGGPYQIAGNVPGTTFSDGPGNLATNLAYYYRVTALSTDGESAFSAEATAAAPSLPTAPTGVTVSVI